MRYIANDEGYLLEVSFGSLITCGGVECTAYTGAVPSGYDSLEDWYLQQSDTLYKWQIVDGNLVEDTTASAPTEVYDHWVGATARLRVTDDGRGNLQLFKSDGTLAVNAYANATSTGGGEVDVHNASGVEVGALYAAVSGIGVLSLKDASGNECRLTAELIQKLIDL